MAFSLVSRLIVPRQIRLQLEEDLAAEGFKTFKCRGPLRYDLQVPSLDHFPEFADEAPWLPLVESILG
jgi:hypothetical protein